MTREELIELAGDDELLFADGFDEAILGIGARCGQPQLVVYSHARCIDILLKRGVTTVDEAEEYFEFNVAGAWMGDRTPLFLYDAEAVISR